MARSRKNYIVLGVIIGIIILAVVLKNTLPQMLLGFIITSKSRDDGLALQERTYHEISYTELTSQQRLEDFDYLFSMIKTSLPYVYDMNEKFDFSVLDKEDSYRKAVAECKDDYSFLALMTSILNDIPSGHATFFPPDYYSYFLSGYYRSDTIGINLTENMQGKLEAYAKYLVEKQSEYNEKIGSGIYFNYTDGEYICVFGDESESYSVLVSVNGNEPEEFITEMVSPTGKIQYDPKNDEAYRSTILFSTAGNKPVTLKLRLNDGTECEKQYYCDYDLCYAYDMAWYYSDEVYDYITEDGEVFESAPDAEEEDADILTDEENNLAYISITSLNYSDGSAVKEKISEYSDYENIIIDLRGNGGGAAGFYKNYIYPALYKDNASFETTGYVPKNNYTNGLFSSISEYIAVCMANNVWFSDTDEYPEKMYDCNNGEYYKYTASYELYGDKTLSYSDNRNVYYIVNSYTCSAADEIVQIVKSCNLGKVVGTNTAGEGLIFGVCCDWLPNSLLMYQYCPTYAIDSEGVNNNLYGTQPDIYAGVTVEESLHYYTMSDEGTDVYSLPARRIWDNNYKVILKEIGTIKDAA